LARDWPCWACTFNHVDGSLVLLPSCAAGKRLPGRGAVEIDTETLKKVLLHSSRVGRGPWSTPAA
jgi:hypothetical protein